MNLQQLRLAFQEWYGEPHYKLTAIAAPEQEMNSSRLDILYYFGEDVELSFYVVHENGRIYEKF